MHLTPVDILNKEFKKVVRGYNPKEVDRFLEVVSQDYEELLKANYDMKEKLEKVNQTVNQYQQIENTLHNTMVLAQQTSEEVRHTANREADLIIREARAHVESLLAETRQKIDKMTFEYEEIKRRYDACKSQFKTFLLTQLQVAESQEAQEKIAEVKVS